MGIYDRDYYRQREEERKPNFRWVILAVLLLLALLVLIKVL